MKILAIETSTEACSAALYLDTGTRVRYQFAPRQHAELILPMINELLSESGTSLNQLDALAFGRGPGAFTGVRIATGVIQGLSYSADLPVLAISSLAALAQSGIHEQENIITAFDARMGEIYYAAYQRAESGLAELLNKEDVVKAEEAHLPEDGNWYGLGTGWDKYSNDLSARLQRRLTGYTADVFPSAEYIIPLALRDLKNNLAVSADKISPVYLRNKVTN